VKRDSAGSPGDAICDGAGPPKGDAMQSDSLMHPHSAVVMHVKTP